MNLIALRSPLATLLPLEAHDTVNGTQGTHGLAAQC